MRYFPINVDIHDKVCVVIGGGNVANRKVRSLIKAGAKIRLVSPEIKDALRELASVGIISWTERRYEAGDLEGATLAFVAVDDRSIGELVSREARERNILLNVADITDQCDFTLSSCLERGDLMITISTGGKCPALARHMRIRLEGLIGDEYGPFLDILGDAREKLISNGVGHDKCKELLNKLIISDILPLIKTNKMAEAEALADRTVAEAVKG